MGLTLITAGIAKALSAIGHHRTQAFAVAWLVPLLLFGLELLVYTEAGASSGHGH